VEELSSFSYVYVVENDWPGVKDMPEYENMKRLDPYVVDLRGNAFV
jgi:hypothetical protein